MGCSPRRAAFGGYPNAMLAKTATSWEEENGPFSSAMTVMTMMTVLWRYTHNQGIYHIHRHDRHHRHWSNGLPTSLAWYFRSVLGAGRLRRQFLLSPYKDVIDDILAIVIIGDKDAVYDILVSQKPEGHPGAPAARDSIFGGPGRGPFPAKRQTRKHGGKRCSSVPW